MHVPLRIFLAASAAALVAAAWRAMPAEDARAQEIHFEPIPVSDSIFMLDSGLGGNVGACLGADGVFLIDDQFERTAPQLIEALKRLSDDPAAFLNNTHFPGDHAGGNPILGQGATILAHENVRKRLAGPERDGTPPTAAMLERGLPELTYAEAVTLHVNGETIRAEHYPASHTDGDTVVFFEEANAVHMGDLFFSGRFPFIDMESGGSVDGLIASVEAILGKIDERTKIIPGHGPLSTKADLETYRNMLVDCRARVAAALAEGQDVEQMRAAKLLADYDKWSWAFITADRFLDTLVAAAR
jgi:glyoxylase-like metal-dependent hydrolase (beta-lactamase superfamily II)